MGLEWFVPQNGAAILKVRFIFVQLLRCKHGENIETNLIPLKCGCRTHVVSAVREQLPQSSGTGLAFSRYLVPGGGGGLPNRLTPGYGHHRHDALPSLGPK